MKEKQYDFLSEVDARLRLSFTSAVVKNYDCEVPRRSNSKHRLKPVYLPTSLLKNLASHQFGINKIRNYVKDLSRQMDQELKSDESETIIDRRSGLWSVGAILSTNFGSNAYGSVLGHHLVKNLKSSLLSVRSTAFYATNLTASLVQKYIFESPKIRTFLFNVID